MDNNELNDLAHKGFPRTKILPISGIKATMIRNPQGRDLIQASKLLKNKNDTIGMQFALFRQVVRFDEDQKQWRLDQIEALVIQDITILSAFLEEDTDQEDTEQGDAHAPAPL